MAEAIVLRDEHVPPLLVLVRLGSKTLQDLHLSRSCDESYGRWRLWGFSVLEVPGGDYGLLARLRPVVAERRLVLEADGPELLADGFPVLPTLDRPHWTVVVSTPTEAQFERVRKHFRGPIENPAWARRPGTVR